MPAPDIQVDHELAGVFERASEFAAERLDTSFPARVVSVAAVENLALEIGNRLALSVFTDPYNKFVELREGRRRHQRLKRPGCS